MTSKKFSAGRSGEGRGAAAFRIAALLLVFAAALAWRWHWASRTQVYTYDSYYYLVLARNLRHAFSYSVAGHPHFKFMPLYPMSIAFLNLFIRDLDAAGKLSNVLFASACVFPIYGAGKTVFGHRAGLAAAALFAFEPISTAWSSVPMSEGLFTLLICLGALFFLQWMKGGRRNRLYLCAAVTGLSIVTRWEGFLFLGAVGVFLLAYWWKGRLRFSHLLLFSALALAPFLLFCLRNLVVFGTPLKSAYVEEISNHPEQFAVYGTLGRLRRYLLFSGVDPVGITRFPYQYGYLLVGYGGLALALLVRRTRPYALFLSAWLLFVGPGHFFWYFTSVRFLFPAVPSLCLGGGALLGVPWKGERCREKRGAVVSLYILAGAVVLVLALNARPVINDIFLRNMRWLEDDTGGLAAKEALLWMKDNLGEEGVASNIGPITSFYLGRDAFFLGGWQGFEPADIRPDRLLEDCREKGVRYILTYAWEDDPRVGLEYAGVDPGLAEELVLVRTWYVPPQAEGNWPVYAFLFEVPF
jgi:4-amino-4-deoxy-L-arabinose transferase-like glycosyltransferase